MFKRFTRLVVLGPMFLIACGNEPLGVESPVEGVQQAIHAWGTYHWARTSNPLKVPMVDSVTSDWQAIYTTAVNDWDQSSVLDLGNRQQGDESARARRKCSPIAGKIRACNAAYGPNGWLGLAQIWLSNGHISQGTTKVNDSYSSYFDSTPGERQHVMCQEIGHDFGLGHTSEDGSSQKTCMDYSTDIDSQHPNQHDYDQLTLIYGHTDSFNGASAALPASTPAAMNNLDPAEVAQWGELVRVSANGRGATYEQDFGNGHKVITEVFFAPDRHRGPDHE